MSDGELCTSQSKTGNMVYNFTISDITEDTTAIVGYAKELSISVSPENAGTVEITGDAYEGETVTLKAIPGYEYGFDAWLDKDGNPLSCEDEIYSNFRLPSGGMTVKFKKNLILDSVRLQLYAMDKRINPCFPLHVVQNIRFCDRADL